MQLAREVNKGHTDQKGRNKMVFIVDHMTVYVGSPKDLIKQTS